MWSLFSIAKKKFLREDLQAVVVLVFLFILGGAFFTDRKLYYLQYLNSFFLNLFQFIIYLFFVVVFVASLCTRIFFPCSLIHTWKSIFLFLRCFIMMHDASDFNIITRTRDSYQE